MTHDEYQEQSSRLLDSDLREDESTSLFMHLAACHECRDFMRSALKLRSGLAADPLIVPVSVDGRLRKQFSSPAVPLSESAQSLWSRQVTLRFPVLALLVCFIAAGTLLLLSGRFPFHEPETVYVTRLPAVVITDGTETIQSKK